MKGKGKNEEYLFFVILPIYIAYFVGGKWDYRTVESQMVIKFKYPRKVTLKVWYTV